MKCDWPAGLCPGLLSNYLGDRLCEGDGEGYERTSETGRTDGGQVRLGYPVCHRGGVRIPFRVHVRVGEKRWPELDQSTLQRSTWTKCMRVGLWWY